MSWTVYMLRCNDAKQSLYTGSTTDLARRLRQHNAGKGAKFTRSRLPVHIAYQESQPNRSAAQKREAEIKRMSRYEKLRLAYGLVRLEATEPASSAHEGATEPFDPDRWNQREYPYTETS